MGKKDILHLAKLCDVDSPIEVVKGMLRVRDNSLRTLVEEYSIDASLSGMLFKDIEDTIDIGE